MILTSPVHFTTEPPSWSHRNLASILSLLTRAFCQIFNSSFLDPETQEKSRETPHECFHEMVPTREKEDYRTESGCS